MQYEKTTSGLVSTCKTVYIQENFGDFACHRTLHNEKREKKTVELTSGSGQVWSSENCNV